MTNETLILIIIGILVTIIVAIRTYLNVMYRYKRYKKVQHSIEEIQADWEERPTDYDKHKERSQHNLEHLRKLSHKSAMKDLENDIL